MQFSRKSFTNLQALASGEFGGSISELGGGGSLSASHGGGNKGSTTSMDSDTPTRRTQRCIFVSNQLPLRPKAGGDRHEFEWDEDALIAQAKEGLPDDMEAVYVGCLPFEVDVEFQEEICAKLINDYQCYPVFLGEELKNSYYRRFCKQQLWPLLHYLIPLNPSGVNRFDPELWSAYVRANMMFTNKLVEVLGSLEDDFVWIHDYHLLVLPSLLRKRFHRLKCGIFLHSPFPSSEVFRTFPRREEVMRAMLNADIIGFHTFDYARHFLSCCARMLGLEHKTNRGAILVDYYGREVCIKIMPTGVKPERLLGAFAWPDTRWRRGELLAQFAGRTVLMGLDDMDVFKGIELKLQAFEQVLRHHPEWRGKLVLVQVTSAARAPGRDVDDLHSYVVALVRRINSRYGAEGYEPVVLLERSVPLYERVALLSVADCVVVTATRDGMNLLPYEYVVARQGAALLDAEDRAREKEARAEEEEEEEEDKGDGGDGAEVGDDDANNDATNNSNSTNSASSPTTNPKSTAIARTSPGQTKLSQPVVHSTLVVSEFVGCSPSLSGAIRVNPWSIEALRDAIYSGITLSLEDAAVRHEKHWKYVSSHTVQFWARSYMTDFQQFTRGHARLQCFDLGFALDTFRMVALTSGFRKLPVDSVLKAYARSKRRVLLLDHDGTLVPQGEMAKPKPSESVLRTLRALTADARNTVYVVSGRARAELEGLFRGVDKLGLAAEHGFYWRPPGGDAWKTQDPEARFEWRDIVLPILQVYKESTDGSYIEAKESAIVWHYGNADPDFGSWQAKELLDHLEGVLSNEPIEVVPGQAIIEVKPQGVSKGRLAERVLHEVMETGEAPDFVLCMGNDRSDEDMFTAMEGMAFSPHLPAEVFACTVGQKPSKAPFYVNDPSDVQAALAKIAEVSAGEHEPPPVSGATPPLPPAAPRAGVPPGLPRVNVSQPRVTFAANTAPSP